MEDNYKNLLQKLRNTALSDDILNKLESMAQNSKDSLTGLPDSRAFMYKFQNFLKENKSGILAIVSPNHMEQLNIISGWVIGDIAISGFASLLEEKTDNALCARISGSRFAVLFSGKNIKEVKKIILSLAESLKNLNLPGVELFPEECMTLSAGIVVLHQNRSEYSDEKKFIEEANKRLDHARSKGGNTISLLSGNYTVSSQKLDIKTFEVKRSKDNTLIESEIENLSLNGLICNIADPVLVGEKLEFRIIIKAEEEITEIKLSGKTVWRKQRDGITEDISERMKYNIGVKFEDVSEHTYDILEKCISGGENNV